MTEPNTISLSSHLMTPEEWAFHHKVIGNKLARIKSHLTQKAKSARGLTLREGIALDEINFLLASGLDIDNPIYVGAFDSVTHEKKLLEYKDKSKALTKAELLTKLAEAELELEVSRNSLVMEDQRFQFLLNYFDASRKKKVESTQARQHGKKTNISSIHVAQQKIAQEIIRKLKKLKISDADDSHNSARALLEPIDFKVFCKKMRATCKPLPSPTTLRNYFLQMTGLNSTK